MLARWHARRAVGVKAGLALFVGSTLILAACGSSSSGTGVGSAPTGSPSEACHATIGDLTTGVGGNGTAPKVSGISGKIAVDGSSALAPLFQAAAQEFDSANGTRSSVTPNNSVTGLEDVNVAGVDIGMSDFFASQKEPSPGAYDKLVDHQPAAVAFTLTVSNDLKGRVDNLSKAQIIQIYTGQVTNWGQLGGPDELIRVINRPASSGTRFTFKTYVLGGATETAGTTLTEDTTGAVATVVQATPGAIGYVATGFVTGQFANQVSPVCIDGYDASAANIDAGNYHFWNIEHAYTNGPATGNARALLRYVLSDQVQKNDLLRLSYIPLGSIPANVVSTHTPQGAPAPEQLPAPGS